MGIMFYFTEGTLKEVWWGGQHLLGRETRIHGCLSCRSVCVCSDLLLRGDC